LAQDRGLEFRGTVGYAKHYLDEPGDLLIAGSFKFALSERLGIEPEVSWIRGERFEERGIGVNWVYNFADRGKKVIPYAIIGGGFNNELDKSIDYTSWHGFLNGGFGVKIFAANGLFIAPEGRIGWLALPRLSVSVGYSF
jgi:hypothetical protein